MATCKSNQHFGIMHTTLRKRQISSYSTQCFKDYLILPPLSSKTQADGLNHIHDFSIMFESVMNNELITFKDTAMLYRTAPHTSRITLDRQIVTEVSIPSQIYSRFISQFYDIAEEQLRPAFK